MANKYFLAAGGNFTDTTKWAASAADAAANTNSSSTPTSSDTAFLIAASGQCTISGTSLCQVLDASLYLNTLTHNSSQTLTVSGDITFGVGMTYTPVSTATLRMNNDGILTTNGQLLANFSTLTTGTQTLGSNVSIIASNAITWSLARTFDLGGFTVTGNSSVNRLLITAGTLGTQTTISNAISTSFNNVDFRDKSFTTAGALDLTNSGVNLIGDCGGNSATGGALTMTTTSTQTWDGSTGNASTAASWTSRVPLPQDTIVFGNGTGTCTYDMPRMGSDISFTSAVKLTLNNAVTSYGSLDFTGAGTFVQQSWTFESGARAGTLSLKTASKTFTVVNFSVTGTAILSLDDAFLSNSTVTCYTTNSLKMNSFTHTFNKGSGTPFTGRGTIDAGTSTIAFTDNGEVEKTFAGGSITYYKLSITGGGGGAIIVSGSNTFNTITVNAPKTLTFTDNTTQTVAGFVAVGTVGNLITLNSSSAGTAATLTKTGGGSIQCDYLDITDVNVTPSNTWYYGTHSNWHSGTGWIYGIFGSEGFGTRAFGKSRFGRKPFKN